MTKSQKPRKRGPIAIERAAERDVMASKVAATGGRTRMIKLDHITVPPDRMRQLRSDLIDELAESIKQQGQLQPIIVRPQDSGYALTAGRHRLEAVRKLGHEEIECRVLEGFSADQTLITEIDENLVRADLTPSERAAHHAERKRLYLRLYPETGKGGDRKSAKAKSKRQNVAKTYTKAAARATGKTSRTVERDISRGEKIDPQALADLDRTCLDNGTELDALAKLPAAEQRRLAEAAKRGEKVSAISALSACGPEAPKTNDCTGKEPDRAPTLDPRAWSMATARERQAFVKAVGRSEIEDAFNAIESVSTLTRGLNALNQAWSAATESDRRAFYGAHFPANVINRFQRLW